MVSSGGRLCRNAKLKLCVCLLCRLFQSSLTRICVRFWKFLLVQLKLLFALRFSFRRLEARASLYSGSLGACTHVLHMRADRSWLRYQHARSTYDGGALARSGVAERHQRRRQGRWPHHTCPSEGIAHVNLRAFGPTRACYTNRYLGWSVAVPNLMTMNNYPLAGKAPLSVFFGRLGCARGQLWKSGSSPRCLGC